MLTEWLLKAIKKKSEIHKNREWTMTMAAAPCLYVIRCKELNNISLTASLCTHRQNPKKKKIIHTIGSLVVNEEEK